MATPDRELLLERLTFSSELVCSYCFGVQTILLICVSFVLFCVFSPFFPSDLYSLKKFGELFVTLLVFRFCSDFVLEGGFLDARGL